MDEPLANAIKEYFSLCKLIGGAKDPWCAAFMYWCIIESKYKGPASSPASAFSWRENSWKDGEIYKPEENNGIGKPFIGAIAVMDFRHVTLVVGNTQNSGEIAGLGGNQAMNPGEEGLYIKVSRFKKANVLCYMKPKGYTVSAHLEKLPTLNVSGDVANYENSR